MTDSDNALEQLIGQFAQPLAFLRELVQNSLDAGTALIEIFVDYDQEAKSCYVTVKDTGQGMDREIIDKRLTRLFSSTKEDDLTKIGKFGIGFVSIFAVKPKLVVLETGRDGEFWRVLFKPDRSFEKRELATPIEGTSVTVFTPYSEKRLAKLKRDTLETVTFWCKHSDVEITFNGTPINESFDLQNEPYQYRHKIEGTEVVMAPCREEVGTHGYYNRGLTLLEGNGSPIPHLNFKIRSRYLEHTLSRDNILMDSHYKKAMKEVEKAAFTAMPLDIFQQIKTQPDSHELWNAARIVTTFPSVQKKIRKIKVFESNQEKYSLAQLPSNVYIWPQIDDFWTEVEATEQIIIKTHSTHPRVKFLTELGYTPHSLDDIFLRYESIEATEQQTKVCDSLRKFATHLPSAFLVKSPSDRPSIFQNRLVAYLSPNQGLRHIDHQDKKRGDGLGLFSGHRLLSEVCKIMDKEPELATSLLLRKIHLDLGLGNRGESKALTRFVESLKVRMLSE